MRFGLFARGDIADSCRHQDSLGAFQRAQHDLDWELASILSAAVEFNASTDLWRQRVCRGSKSIRDQPFRKALRNDVFHLLAHEFIAPVSELFLRLNV